MKSQNIISKQKMQDKVGNIYEVLVEDISNDGLFLIGRSYMDSPDTDGLIYISNGTYDLIGKFIKCRIITFEDYDLYGEIV